jgi:protein-tyrosine-phosphatase
MTSFRGHLTSTFNRAAKKLLPDALVREIRQFRAYEKRERPIYLKLRISNGLGLTKPKLQRAPKTARKVLFVCFGNIMRSPMCEALMNRELLGLDNAQFTVTSAGLNATPGRLAHPWAIAAAREFSVSLERHHARLLTRQMVNEADAIFAMDYQNQVQLLSRWADARNKIVMLAAYSGQEYPSVEIADPYYQDQEQTRRCYQILDTCIRNLVCSLAR